MSQRQDGAFFVLGAQNTSLETKLSGFSPQCPISGGRHLRAIGKRRSRDVRAATARGAFIRSKMLWEIALGVAGDASIPYFGNRDVAISIGNGSQAQFK